MGERSYDFECINVQTENQVAWVRLQWPDGKIVAQKFHRELAACLQALRSDDGVRVVVLRGATEHKFMSPFAGIEERGHLERFKKGVMSDPENVFAGMRETEQILGSITRMEKPVIAMVNGDALGNGASLAMSCDLIVADEDAYITDLHIANHHFVQKANPSTGVVPGDGSLVFWPLQMGLVKAKEYLLTGRPIKAKELARMNAINRAVPHAELQSAVDELIDALLARPAWALGWTKMLINKRARANMELTLDVGAALLGISMRVRDDFPGPKGIRTL